MKKILLATLLTTVFCSFSYSQQWMTSFELAKRLALVKNRMILAVWENATKYPYAMLVADEKGNYQTVELFRQDSLNTNESINKLIWKHFVPVIIPEYKYEDLISEIEGKRSLSYINKFNDDEIKIMDANGNILNVLPPKDPLNSSNLTYIFSKYALNTSFLRQELDFYSEKENFTTAFRLGYKYLEFALFFDKSSRKEITDLSDIYIQEAKDFLPESGVNNKEGFIQKMELLEIEKQLIIGKPKKALRMLKRFDANINPINNQLFAFLNYTTYRCLSDMENAMKWQDKVNATDLKKVKQIVN